MKKFVIITDSCCDLTKEMREQYDVSYVPMHLLYDGEDHVVTGGFRGHERFAHGLGGVPVLAPEVQRPAGGQTAGEGMGVLAAALHGDGGVGFLGHGAAAVSGEGGHGEQVAACHAEAGFRLLHPDGHLSDGLVV